MTGRWPSSSRILLKPLPKPLGQLTESNRAREWTGLVSIRKLSQGRCQHKPYEQKRASSEAFCTSGLPHFAAWLTRQKFAPPPSDERGRFFHPGSDILLL